MVRFVINALGVLAASIVPGIEIHDTTSLAIVVVLLGLFNVFLKPMLLLLALPFVVATLGLGIVFINALALLGAAAVTEGYEVSGFLAAFFGALVIGIVNLVLGPLAGEGVVVQRPRPPPPSNRPAPTRLPVDDDIIDI